MAVYLGKDKANMYLRDSKVLFSDYPQFKTVRRAPLTQRQLPVSMSIAGYHEDKFWGAVPLSYHSNENGLAWADVLTGETRSLIVSGPPDSSRLIYSDLLGFTYESLDFAFIAAPVSNLNSPRLYIASEGSSALWESPVLPGCAATHGEFGYGDLDHAFAYPLLRYSTAAQYAPDARLKSLRLTNGYVMFMTSANGSSVLPRLVVCHLPTKTYIVGQNLPVRAGSTRWAQGSLLGVDPEENAVYTFSPYTMNSDTQQAVILKYAADGTISVHQTVIEEPSGENIEYRVITRDNDGAFIAGFRSEPNMDNYGLAYKHRIAVLLYFDARTKQISKLPFSAKDEETVYAMGYMLEFQRNDGSSHRTVITPKYVFWLIDRIGGQYARHFTDGVRGLLAYNRETGVMDFRLNFAAKQNPTMGAVRGKPERFRYLAYASTANFTYLIEYNYETDTHDILAELQGPGGQHGQTFNTYFCVQDTVDATFTDGQPMEEIQYLLSEQGSLYRFYTYKITDEIIGVDSRILEMGFEKIPVLTPGETHQLELRALITDEYAKEAVERINWSVSAFGASSPFNAQISSTGLLTIGPDMEEGAMFYIIARLDSKDNNGWSAGAYARVSIGIGSVVQ